MTEGRLSKWFADAGGYAAESAMQGVQMWHVNHLIDSNAWKKAFLEAEAFHNGFYQVNRLTIPNVIKARRAKKILRLAGYVGRAIEVTVFVYMWIKADEAGADGLTEASNQWARDAVFADEVEAVAAWGRKGIFKLLGKAEKRWLNLYFGHMLDEVEALEPER